MGRDILSFSEPTPTERIGLGNLAQLKRDQPEVRRPDAPGPETNPASVDTPKGRGGLYLAMTAVGLLIAAGVGYYLWSTAGRVDLRYIDHDIANAEEMLATADTTFSEAIAADGAVADKDAGCYFAPINGNPTVVCGPTWLGVSSDDEPWLVLDTSYQLDDENAIGEVGAVRATTAVDERSLARPDGRRPLEPGEPIYPTSGPRHAGGELIVDVGPLLDGAEAAFAEYITSDESAISIADDASCYLLQDPDLIHNMPITDRAVWCGPARSVTSGLDQIWAPVNISYDRGPFYGSVQYGEAQNFSNRLRAIPEGATLYRPDGQSAPDAGNVDRPPVANDFAEVVDYRVDLSDANGNANANGDAAGSNSTGVLITERYRIDFETLARTDRVGTGAQSFAAPADHDLIVAAVAPAEGSVSPRGVLVIDGAERPLPNWRDGDDGATLIMAVPRSARQVAMTVENNGRPQTISLIDGLLVDGYPLALYRTTVEPAQPFTVRIDMPVGEAVLVSGTVESVTWQAKDQDRNWLPEGLADLQFNFDGWKVDRPCCDVRIDDVVATFVLRESNDQNSTSSLTSSTTTATTTPTGDDDTTTTSETTTTTSPSPPATYDDQREDPTGSPSSRGPRFRVPEDITEVVLDLQVVVTYTVDDQEQTAVVDQEFPVVLP